MILTIAIPTVKGREESFNELLEFIKSQISDAGLLGNVEVISISDNKEISIGAKRQKLIELASGEYIVQIDDDDWVAEDYVIKVIEALKTKPDCVGYRERCELEGIIKNSCFSIRFKEWASNVDGFNFVRTPFFKCPIKTPICKMVGSNDMRFGEDHDFAIRVYPFLTKEYFIDKEMYIYRYKKENHAKKYGFDKQ